MFFLFGCLNNSTQVWVSDLDTNIRPKSLEKVKPIKYKKEKNFLKDKKVFIFSPFIRTELLKFKEILFQNSLTNTTVYFGKKICKLIPIPNKNSSEIFLQRNTNNCFFFRKKDCWFQCKVIYSIGCFLEKKICHVLFFFFLSKTQLVKNADLTHIVHLLFVEF